MDRFKAELHKIIRAVVGSDVELEIPPDHKMGDYALPCFSLSKKLKKDPEKIAIDLKEKITAPFLDKTEIKGAYLNFFVNRETFCLEVIKKVQKDKENYGKGKGIKEKIMIEFSQANTHKAFHIGHVRGTSVGESLARILNFNGKNVIRVNYQGDTGMHVAKWLWCYTKFRNGEKLQKDEEWMAKIYVDAIKKFSDDNKGEIDQLNKKLDEGKDKKLSSLWKQTRKLSLDLFEGIYKELNTHFDHYFFESEQETRAKEISGELIDKKVAELSDGAVIVNLEDYDLGVWILIRGDGTVLYGSKDLSLAKEKFEKYKIDRSIYIAGKEQELHFRQLFKTLELMEYKHAKDCYYIPVSLVKLPEGRMSSRTGDNILYSSFIKELQGYAMKIVAKRFKLDKKNLEKRGLAIGIAALKYSMIKQNPNKEIVFDKIKAIKFEGDTGPYLQYSFARATSIVRKSNVKEKKTISTVDEKEYLLLRLIYSFEEIIEKSATSLNPSIVANYASDLCASFNEFYANCQVIGTQEESFRIQIVDVFRITLQNSLNLLGIEALEEM